MSGSFFEVYVFVILIWTTRGWSVPLPHVVNRLRHLFFQQKSKFLHTFWPQVMTSMLQSLLKHNINIPCIFKFKKSSVCTPHPPNLRSNDMLKTEFDTIDLHIIDIWVCNIVMKNFSTAFNCDSVYDLLGFDLFSNCLNILDHNLQYLLKKLPFIKRF